MAGYKISYDKLNSAGNDLVNISKDMALSTEAIATVSKQLSSDPMLAEVRAMLKAINAQLTESYTVMKEAGKILVSATEKYKTHETATKQTITNTGVAKTDYHGNSAAGSTGQAQAGSAAGSAAGATQASGAGTVSTGAADAGQAGAGTTSTDSTASGTQAQPGPSFTFIDATQTGATAGAVGAVGAVAGAAGIAVGAAAVAAINTVKSKKSKQLALNEDSAVSDIVNPQNVSVQQAPVQNTTAQDKDTLDPEDNSNILYLSTDKRLG